MQMKKDIDNTEDIGPISVVVLSILHSGIIAMIRCFDHKGLHQDRWKN